MLTKCILLYLADINTNIFAQIRSKNDIPYCTAMVKVHVPPKYLLNCSISLHLDCHHPSQSYHHLALGLTTVASCIPTSTVILF